MGFCDNLLVKSTPLYAPCWLMENRRGLHAFGVFMVGMIIMVLVYAFTKSNIAFYTMIPLSLMGAFATYQYDLITRAVLFFAAPGAGTAIYESASALEEAVNPAAGSTFDKLF